MTAAAGRPGGQSVVVLYGRPGCHLCEFARGELLAMRRAGASFELREIDIEGDDRLHREMLESIPVVEVDGARVSELIFDADAVRARLATFVE
jgi:glutaredoxin